MDFQNHHILFIIAIVWMLLCIVFLLWRYYTRREKLKKKYVLLFNQNPFHYVRYIVLALSLSIIVFSLFDIEYWNKRQKWTQNGVDIVFVLDVSKSMNVQDVSLKNIKLSRLQYAKNIINNTILESPENRYWLVIFAWDAISASPLTFDHSTFLTFLKNVDYRNLQAQWTNLEKAVELGVMRLTWSGEESRSRAMIILSDWGDSDDSTNTNVIAKILKDDVITSVTIWIWSKKGWKIPNWRDRFGRSIYQKYKWQYVESSLFEWTLKKIASKSWGQYLKVSDTKGFILSDSLISELEKTILVFWEVEWKSRIARLLWLIAFACFVLYLIMVPWRIQKRIL